MSMKRTNVYADAEDLALIKQAAKQRGIAEAEIIREGIHLAALSYRVWDESLDWPTFEGNGEPVSGDDVTRAVAEGADWRDTRS
ncbi:CopG family transcriptional regulator [Nocardia puris]|uniref:ribbon-helix-helix domain-containing protein n=1 Tax=Nocardia puris TaxID=208602 RepID=UPI001893B804|nr:CopG family transcriptional regulator [Nocardia puris]MBF6210759.1 CopG family transcriptional regulator [Nocardia puris]